MARDKRITTPEAARRLELEPEDVYRLIFAGELAGDPDSDGVVRVSEQTVAEYATRRSEA